MLEDMRAVRPVVETGYENIMQVRLLLDGTSAEEILDRWRCVLASFERSITYKLASPACGVRDVHDSLIF